MMRTQSGPWIALTQGPTPHTDLIYESPDPDYPEVMLYHLNPDDLPHIISTLTTTARYLGIPLAEEPAESKSVDASHLHPQAE
jgi:hypothetical protein